MSWPHKKLPQPPAMPFKSPTLLMRMGSLYLLQLQAVSVARLARVAQPAGRLTPLYSLFHKICLASARELVNDGCGDFKMLHGCMNNAAFSRIMWQAGGLQHAVKPVDCSTQ